MALVRKHFQITDKQLEFIQSQVKDGISESHIVRAALDEWIKRKEKEDKK
jgi:Arc/MetJ-type ribon-helix-helix transcriptional regulator